MVHDCEQNTTVVFAVAETNSKTVKVSASTVLEPQNGGFKERKGYRFQHWYSRCSACYLRELDQIRHQQDPVQEKLKQLREMNPELFFKPQTEEDRLDYAEMCMSYIKNSMRRSAKPPYKNERPQLDTSEAVLTGKTITREQIDNVDVSEYMSGSQV